MADEKCFCHFMGYKVKDSTAQKLIEENKDNVFEKNKDSRLKFWIGTEAEYSALEKYEENCLYLTTDDDTQLFLTGLQKQINDTLSHFNKVLYEDSTGISSGNDINNINLTDYSLFAVTIHSTIANVTVLCNKTTYPTGGEFVSGFNIYEGNSERIYYAKFQSTITENGFSSPDWKLSTTPEFTDNYGMSVIKIVGIM